MNASFQMVLSLFSLSMAVASPIQNEALTKRQVSCPVGPGFGRAALCTACNQCASIQVPFDFSQVCFDFSGNMAFLNDQLKTVTLESVDCLLYEDNQCSGTVLGSAIALGGIEAYDTSNLDGHDFSGVISSVKCGFL